jgi:tripeptide aminopeptidase
MPVTEVSSCEIEEPVALDLLLRLLRIPGKSREELAIQRQVIAELTAAGIDPAACVIDDAHRRIPEGGVTGNLIVKLPGTIRGPRRMLMAHVDTVPICVGTDPYVDGEFVRSRAPGTGLGGDDRAGVAVVLTAIREILSRKLPHPPLTLFLPVQEEVGLAGSRFCSVTKLGKPQMAFNWDGNEPDMVCRGATGQETISVTIHGIASHAGVHPELGVSATAIAALALADLVQAGWHGLIQKGKQAGTSNVGIIHAGEATNVVTPLLTLKAEARSHQPAFRAKIVKAFRTAFERAAKQLKSADGRRGRIEFDVELKYEAFQLSADAPVVQLAEGTLRAQGLTPRHVIANGGLDANWMTAHGIPTVTFGCGQRAIHTVDEHLHLPSYYTACRTAIALATRRI